MKERAPTPVCGLGIKARWPSSSYRNKIPSIQKQYFTQHPPKHIMRCGSSEKEGLLHGNNISERRKGGSTVRGDFENPEACHRLMDTFNDSLDMADVLDAPEISAQQFTTALFNAYANKDLSAFLMAICQHSMFDCCATQP